MGKKFRFSLFLSFSSDQWNLSMSQLKNGAQKGRRLYFPWPEYCISINAAYNWNLCLHFALKKWKMIFFNWLAFSFLLTIPSSYDFYLWVYSTHTKLPAFEQFWNILDLFLQLIFCSYLLFFSFFASFPFLQLLSCFTCVRWIDWGPCSSGKATLT